ncbi:LIRP-like isoform X2 [Lutzomyia longipalpis]|uniref:LIRP-like isoform X2 n=1 Tax=Lutzomyia longipalpis TaxID=7200 RepID=UPI0024845C92|nr:LIRP-like isoform X2 [Lutzomyia longipalpis]
MNNLIICVILVACVILAAMAKEIDQHDRDLDTDFLHKLSRRRLCGTKLSQTLALVCENEYNTMQKKSFDDDYAFADQPQTIDDLPMKVPNLPLISRLMGNSMRPAMFRRFRRQGIIDECCRKSCTYSELKGYCGR